MMGFTETDPQHTARRARSYARLHAAGALVMGLILGGALLSLGACGGSAQAPPVASVGAREVTALDLPAARMDASKPTIDPRTMPATRAPLADMPDLHGAELIVTDSALARMQAHGLPADVARALAPMKGRGFGNPAEFLAVVEDRIGAQALAAHKGTILRYSLVVTPSDPPPPPQGRADLAEVESYLKAESVMAAPQPAGTLGSSRFQPVFFDFDKADLKPEFQGAVRYNAQVLLGDAGLKIVIEGHCDERGSTEYNLALGERRALTVRQALLREGVPSARLVTVSYGEERPFDPRHNEDAWAKNRRAVIEPQ